MSFEAYISRKNTFRKGDIVKLLPSATKCGIPYIFIGRISEIIEVDYFKDSRKILRIKLSYKNYGEGIKTFHHWNCSPRDISIAVLKGEQLLLWGDL